MEHIFVNELNNGMSVNGYYILSDYRIGTTKNNKQYANASLIDTSGKIPGVMWDIAGNVTAEKVGSVIYAEGTVGMYNDKPQLTLSFLRTVSEQELTESCDLGTLVPVAPIDVEDCLLYLNDFVFRIKDSTYHTLVITLFNKYLPLFKRIPAGKSVHHSFISGLLMHTTNMLHIAERVADTYGDSIDDELLFSGVILHDICKCREFTLSDLGLVKEYSVEGQLFGHAIMCAEEIGQIGRELNLDLEKVKLLQHVILSHHGNPEQGAAVKPMCIEAELLHCIDMVDSRAAICIEATANLTPGKFTQKIFALDRRILKH
jgi:3'-5' exoribonuclease